MASLGRELACNNEAPNKGQMRCIETCERQHAVRVAISTEFLLGRRTNTLKITEHRRIR